MSSSSLQRTGEKPPVVNKGHGTEALGPSDRSDTGSDITGAPGLNEENDMLHLQPGTTSDADHNLRGRRKTAGPDVGDENLDSDSDSGGTGERAAAGRDAPPANDQQLNVVDASGAETTMSDEELQEELAGDESEFASDIADTDEEGSRSARGNIKTPTKATARKAKSGGARPRARTARRR